MSKQHLDLIVLAGPTASGKSSLALQLAESLGGCVINADSMQIYADLQILTARPDAAAMARAPHRLYGILSAGDISSAARWREMALAEIALCRQQGRIPIVTGGTGLYLRTLLEGIADIPDIPAEMREEAQRRYDELGGDEFRRMLAADDPIMAARLPAGDRQRLIRAYEVIHGTGRSLREWQTQPYGANLFPDAAIIVFDPPRDELYRRCEQRLQAMLEKGALREVASLLERNLDPALPVMKSLGVPEFAAHLRGELTLPQALAAAQQSTRRYAKRQTTWFRHQVQADLRLKQTESFEREIFAFIRQFQLTGLT